MITRQPKPEDESRESKPTASDGDAGRREPESSDDVSTATRQKEVGGRQGPDPTRYGDWEKGGRCIDF